MFLKLHLIHRLRKTRPAYRRSDSNPETGDSQTAQPAVHQDQDGGQRWRPRPDPLQQPDEEVNIWRGAAVSQEILELAWTLVHESGDCPASPEGHRPRRR